jgi:chromate transporter
MNVPSADDLQSDPHLNRPRPQSLRDLFISFTLLALQGFGGVMAVVQRELVERKRWLTREEFVEDWAVAQIMPGPNVVNLSIIIGGRYFGLRGALTAFAGILTVPLILILLIAVLYAPYAHEPHVAHMLRAMGAVASGLILATGLRLLGAMQKNVIGLPLCLILGGLCFVAVAIMRLPLVYPLFGLGAIALALAYRKLKP